MQAQQQIQFDATRTSNEKACRVNPCIEAPSALFTSSMTVVTGFLMSLAIEYS